MESGPQEQRAEKSSRVSKFGWDLLDWSTWIIFIFQTLLICFLGLNWYRIIDPSDGYYSEGAREMLSTGNFIVPHFNYAPFFDKPILNYWLIAFAYKVLGVSEASARVPAALCASLVIIFSYPFLRQFLRRRAAWGAAMVLLSTPYWLVIGHLSLTDMPLSCLVWLSTGFLISGELRKRDGFLWLGYIALGLAILCKGPIGLLLVCLNVFLFYGLKCQSIKAVPAELLKLRPAVGLLLAASVALPWYLRVNDTTHGAFIREFFFEQNLRRAAGLVDHPGSFYYYLPVLFFGAFPWSAIFLNEASRPLTKFADQLISKTRSVRGAISDLFVVRTKRQLITKFAVFSCISVTVAFSLLPTKLDTYVLPVFPTIAIAVGIALDRLSRRRRANDYMGVASFLIVAVLGAIWFITNAYLVMTGIKKPFGLFADPKNIHALMMLLFESYFRTELIVLVLFCLILTITSLLLFFGRSKRAAGLLLAGTAFSVAALVPFGLYDAYIVKCSDFHTLLKNVLEDQVVPITVGRRLPSVIFYSQVPVLQLKGPVELVQYVDTAPPDRIYLINSDLVELLRYTRHQVDVRRTLGDWSIVRTSPALK